MIFRDFISGDDGEVIIFQKPNWPVYGMILSYMAKLLPVSEAARQLFGALFILLLFIWSLLEIFTGDSPIRRVFGLVGLLVAIRLIT